MGELSEDGPDDWESLDASAAHIANLLAAEPADGNLGLNYLKMINLLGFIFSLISCNSSWLNPAQVLKKLFPNGKKPSL